LGRREKMTFTKPGTVPMFLKVPEVAEILQIPKKECYELIKQNKDFPYYRISERRIRIPRDEFFEWMKKHCKETDWE